MIRGAVLRSYIEAEEALRRYKLPYTIVRTTATPLDKWYGALLQINGVTVDLALFAEFIGKDCWSWIEDPNSTLPDLMGYEPQQEVSQVGGLRVIQGASGYLMDDMILSLRVSEKYCGVPQIRVESDRVQIVLRPAPTTSSREIVRHYYMALFRQSICARSEWRVNHRIPDLIRTPACGHSVETRYERVTGLLTKLEKACQINEEAKLLTH